MSISDKAGGSGQANEVVLVTGGSGFIGTHLCRRLQAAGAEVHATSRRAGLVQPRGVTWWPADMAQASEARRVLGAIKPTVIYHLAGSVGAGPDLELVLPTYHSLLTSTVNILLEAAELGSSRVILSGSFTEPVPGTDAPTPGSPYAAAKWASSAYGRMFHALYNSPVVILRPFMTYGPQQNATKLIPYVVQSLLRGEAPRLSSGRVKADWVYIADIVDAFLAAARHPGLEGRTLDLGTGRLTSIRAVVDGITAEIGNGVAPVFGAIPDRPAENEIAADIGPAAKCLGWRAATSLRDGLRQTVDWYRSVARR